MAERQRSRSIKSWPMWVLMALIASSLLVVGGTRDSGPQSPEDRVDDITQRLACPVCNGESVFASQNNSSRTIRTQVEDFVRANELTDDEILAYFEQRDAEILLVPKSTGLEALAWMLPVFALAVGLVGLAFAFRRWREESSLLRDPTQADRDLVAAALLADDDSGDEAAPAEAAGASDEEPRG